MAFDLFIEVWPVEGFVEVMVRKVSVSCDGVDYRSAVKV